MKQGYPSYNQLLQQRGGESLTYLELLNTAEWWQLRQQILKRDNHTCKHCQRQQTIARWDNESHNWQHYEAVVPSTARRYANSFCVNGGLETFYIYDERDIIFTVQPMHRHLHIHHTYYKHNSLPWQYNLDALETLCLHCHAVFHQQHTVPVYTQLDGKWIEWKDITACRRCSGAGILPSYSHVDGGVCFRCWGARYEELITDKLKEKSKGFYEKYKK